MWHDGNDISVDVDDDLQPVPTMAANAPNTIKLQKVESELTVQFQIDDLHSAFTRSSASKYTEHFGPGLRFGSYSFVDGSEPSHIGLYLYTSKEYPGLAIHWAVATKSLNGAQTYQTKQMAYTFRAGEAIGWSKFLTADMFHAHGALRADNAMAVHATLRFVPVWPIVLRPTLDVLHRAVVGRAPPHVRFVAYARRDANGRLSAPAAFFATRAAVAQRSDIFADRTSSLLSRDATCTNKARSVRRRVHAALRQPPQGARAAQIDRVHDLPRRRQRLRG